MQVIATHVEVELGADVHILLSFRGIGHPRAPSTVRDTNPRVPVVRGGGGRLPIAVQRWLGGQIEPAVLRETSQALHAQTLTGPEIPLLQKFWSASGLAVAFGARKGVYFWDVRPSRAGAVHAALGVSRPVTASSHDEATGCAGELLHLVRPSSERLEVAMRPLFLSLVLLMSVPSVASAQMVQETWSEQGQILGMGQMVPDANLEILLGFTSVGRILAIDQPSGEFYRLPPEYGSGNKVKVLIRDFDLDGLDELLVYLDPSLDLDEQIGFFDLWPDPGPVWQLCCGYWYDSLQTANLTGEQLDLVLHRGEGFWVVNLRSGTIYFEWGDGYPSMRVLAVQVLDLDGDGLDELLVQAEEDIGLFRKLYILELAPGVGIDADLPTVHVQELSARSTPNPFHGKAQIGFQLPSRSRVSVRVFDTAGRLIATLVDEVRAAGAHQVAWDGTNANGETVRSGAYFCEVQSGGRRMARKMIRIR